jgi:hypothetical protein
MLKIFTDVFSGIAKSNSTISPLGEDDRYRLFLEQSRRERRLAQLRADQKFYRQG